MSTPMAETTPRRRRPRRRFDDDFKAQAVRLVLDEGKSIGAVARDLDLTETALRDWVQRARANRTRGRTGLTTAEREELTQWRKENRQLRLEREILKNAAAFLRKSQRHVRADSREEGDLSHCDDVSGARRLDERVLRVVPAAGIAARAARSAAARDGARLARRIATALRSTPRVEGSARGRRARQ